MNIEVAIFAILLGVARADLPYHQPASYHQPYHAQPSHYCDPKQAPACARAPDYGHPQPYCLDDEQYPKQKVAEQIAQDPLIVKKYSDVPGQSADDLVDHVTAYQEHAYDYSYYTGPSKGPSPFDLTHWCGPEGYLCPSHVNYGEIKRAVNVEGQWRVIVQHISHGYSYGQYNYTQTTRLETCLNPGSACRLLAPCYNSKCTQKYVFHRMLSLDLCDPHRGLFIDTFKLPSACSCHVPQH